MIRFDQRHFDVQGTEKVFKKVVHPGQNIRLVDKDGIPLKAPNSSTLSRLRSQYVLSPRGVPTKRSNHSYSGQLAQSKLHNVVNSLDTSTQPEMMSYSSVHNYNGLSSAPSSQHYPTQRYMPGNLTPKKRSFGSGPPRSVKSMPAKTSASTQRSRFLTSAATTTDQMSRTDFDADKSNDSPQGKRLEKEWSALNQCRALKRSSEIVSHRVDRMYFMTGSKLHLQSKYLVEEDDLKHLRELSQARATSRAARDEMKEQARKLMQKHEYENDRLENIERKLSNIERRLSFIEEQADEYQERQRDNESVHIQGMDDGSVSSSSSESGIHEDDLKYNSDEASEPDVDKEVADIQGNVSGDTDDLGGDSAECPVSRIEIRKRHSAKKESAGIQVWDILKHEKTTTSAETMIKLFETYPNVHARARNVLEKDTYDTVNALTLGIPRKIRRSKRKISKKTNQHALPAEIVGKPPPLGCRVCESEKYPHRKKDESVYVPRDTRRDHLQQSFPARKPSIKIVPHPPVECDCRLDPWKGKGPSGPLLSVKGTQVPLFDRDCY